MQNVTPARDRGSCAGTGSGGLVRLRRRADCARRRALAGGFAPGLSRRCWSRPTRWFPFPSTCSGGSGSRSMRRCRWRLPGSCCAPRRPTRSSAATGGTRSSCSCWVWPWICAGLTARGQAGCEPLNELFLVDAGLYGFLAIRQLSGTGFDFHLKWSDWKTRPARACFLHAHRDRARTGAGLHPSPSQPAGNRQRPPALGGDIFLYRRARRTLLSRLGAEPAWSAALGRRTALVIASILFGLSHFNKRSAHFNWRYVLLATIAGIFYGRAWREHRRVPASTITHASVDWLWGLWF